MYCVTSFNNITYTVGLTLYCIERERERERERESLGNTDKVFFRENMFRF